MWALVIKNIHYFEVKEVETQFKWRQLFLEMQYVNDAAHYFKNDDSSFLRRKLVSVRDS